MNMLRHMSQKIGLSNLMVITNTGYFLLKGKDILLFTSHIPSMDVTKRYICKNRNNFVNVLQNKLVRRRENTLGNGKCEISG